MIKTPFGHNSSNTLIPDTTHPPYLNLPYSSTHIELPNMHAPSHPQISTTTHAFPISPLVTIPPLLIPLLILKKTNRKGQRRTSTGCVPERGLKLVKGQDSKGGVRAILVYMSGTSTRNNNGRSGEVPFPRVWLCSLRLRSSDWGCLWLVKEKMRA